MTHAFVPDAVLRAVQSLTSGEPGAWHTFGDIRARMRTRREAASDSAVRAALRDLVASQRIESRWIGAGQGGRPVRAYRPAAHY